jgi:hypothetical protein
MPFKEKRKMDESAPLYSSPITKIYIQYLQKFYPEIDVDAVLNAF